MDKIGQNGGRTKRRSGVIHTLFGWTGRVYAALRRSAIGRVLTAYRRLDGAVGGGRQGRFRIASRGRMPVADAIKQSHVIAALRGFFRLLYDLPLRFYGLFILLYGAVGAILHFLVPLLIPSFVSKDAYLTVAATMMVISLPPLTSHSTLRQSASRSRICNLILNRYFCIPTEPLPSTNERLSIGAMVCSVSMAFVAAGVALFVSPYLVPVITLTLTVCGLVFFYPETGVLTTLVMLPVAWVFPAVMTPVVGMIMLTWVSYVFKLIRLYRTVRYDVADMAMLLLLVLCIIAGVGGVVLGTGRLMPFLLLTVCLSMYFLVVHLMTSRAYISRCLVGLGLGAVLVIAISLIGRTGASATDWLVGSRGGDLVAEAFSAIRGVAVSVSNDARVLLFILLIPVLYALVLRARRLFTRVMTAALAVLALYFAVSSGSVGALVCLVCTTALFCLLWDHRSLAVGALLLPTAIGVTGWYFARGRLPAADVIERLSRTHHFRQVRVSELWQKVEQNPFGLGLGADCEGGNFAIQMLLTLGWPGLIVAALWLVLLLQKSLTALLYTSERGDRTLMVALLCSVVGALLRGVTYGYLVDASAILTLILLCAMGSALANTLFDEHDVQVASSMDDLYGADRVFRRG